MLAVKLMGCGQVGKAPDFDSGIRRFESCHPSSKKTGTAGTDGIKASLNTPRLCWCSKTEIEICYKQLRVCRAAGSFSDPSVALVRLS